MRFCNRCSPQTFTKKKTGGLKGKGEGAQRWNQALSQLLALRSEVRRLLRQGVLPDDRKLWRPLPGSGKPASQQFLSLYNQWQTFPATDTSAIMLLSRQETSWLRTLFSFSLHPRTLSILTKQRRMDAVSHQPGSTRELRPCSSFRLPRKSQMKGAAPVVSRPAR